MIGVILAGGRGTRLVEKTANLPKPMIKIGRYPIIWHLIKYLNVFGIEKFIVCSGYKSKIIEKYFQKNNNIKVINTGLNTLTAKRIFLIKKYIGINEDFFMTYGDGLANVDINKLIKLHKRKKKLATVTAVLPPPRFGSIRVQNDLAIKFNEKPKDYRNLINGGFFILNHSIFEALDLGKNNEMWEQSPMQKLTNMSELAVYTHKEFWHPMDTLRDNIHLNSLWRSETAPWKIW